MKDIDKGYDGKFSTTMKWEDTEKGDYVFYELKEPTYIGCAVFLLSSASPTKRRLIRLFAGNDKDDPFKNTECNDG